MKFSLTEVCLAVLREGITAYIEHTGGGVMTLYAGSRVDGVWTVAAGPGRYTGTEDDLTLPVALLQSQTVIRGSVGNTEAFSVGPGNMAEWVASPERVWICPELATAAEIADEIIRQVHEHDVQTPVVTHETEVETWPGTEAEREAFNDWQYAVSNGDTLRGYRNWIAAKKEAEQ